MARPERPSITVQREDFGLTSKHQHLYLCAQNLRKFHPDFDALLSGILRRDPNGVLVIPGDTQPAVTEALHERLKNRC